MLQMSAGSTEFVQYNDLHMKKAMFWNYFMAPSHNMLNWARELHDADYN